VINIREMEGIPNEVLAELKVGDRFDRGRCAGGSQQARRADSQPRAPIETGRGRTLYGSQVFEGVVAGHNKGGLIVKIGKVRGPCRRQLVSRGSRGGGEPG
jgi:hypothetical protein